MSGIDGIGAIGKNPFENTEWLSKANGSEETSGILASKETEETGGTLAYKEPNLFDGSNFNGVDTGLFANNDSGFEQEETSGQLANNSAALSVVA